MADEEEEWMICGERFARSHRRDSDSDSSGCGSFGSLLVHIHKGLVDDL